MTGARAELAEARTLAEVARRDPSVGNLQAVRAAITAVARDGWRLDQAGMSASGHGYNPYRDKGGRFAPGAHKQKPKSEAVTKAAAHVEHTAGKRAAAETALAGARKAKAAAVTEARSRLAEARTAAALARKEPSALNVKAAKQATARATAAATLAKQHAATAKEHAGAHAEARAAHIDAKKQLTAAKKGASGAQKMAPPKERARLESQSLFGGPGHRGVQRDDAGGQARDYHGRFAPGHGAAHDAHRVERVRAEATSIAKASGHADHVARGDREAAKEHAAIANEHRAIGAGHIAPIPTAKLAAYDAAHAHAEARSAELKQQLDQHQGHAAAALGKLHAHADAEAGIGHDDLHNPVSDHEIGSSLLGRVAGHHGETSYEAQNVEPHESIGTRPDHDASPAEHAAYDQAHAERTAAYREHAAAAQTALETLHEHQAHALAELKQVDREHERASAAMQREAERHAEHGVRVPESHPEHAAAQDAAESLSGHEADRRGDIASEMRTKLEDAHDALREATRSTARTVRELAGVTGRPAKLAGK